MFNATPEEQRDSAAAISAVYEQGGWHPQIGKTFPLSDAAEAHLLQESNTLQGAGTLTGKIVLVP
jgi:NADPH2:quinone reductase